MNFNIVICLLFGLAIYKINAQLAQTCVCVARNQCYLTNQTGTGNDGSGIIDIRIVNPGDATTVSSAPQPTITPGICAPTLDLCCSGSGVVGCGLRNFIPITPGTTPTPGQMRYGGQPWQVIIFGTDNFYVGGGVLLDSLNVLTAAHKVANRTALNIKIRVGEWDLSRTTEPFPYQEILVSSIRIHPSYVNVANPNLQNDIALLRLSSAVNFNNPAINSICLPTSASSVFDGQRCLVAGWGKDAFNGGFQTIPKEVEVPVIAYTDCQTRLRNTIRLGASFNLDPNSFLCAGGEIGRDACTGDGGSALACIVGGRYQLAGLVAWGIGCADNNVPGVYVKVQNFLPWIQTQMST